MTKPAFDLPPLYQPGAGYSGSLPPRRGPPRRGRPTVFTIDLAAAIFGRLELGIPMAVIGREPGMPAAETVRRWRIADREFERAFLAARLAGYDHLAYLVEAEAKANRERLGRIEALRIFNHRCTELAKRAPRHFGGKEPRA